MASKYDDFYKAMKQLIEEDAETTDQEKATLLKQVEAVEPYARVIEKKDEELELTAEELELTAEEHYILKYLAEHTPEEGQPKSAYDATFLIQLVSMMFIKDHREAVLALNNEEARLDFIKSITKKDLEEIKLDRKDEKVAALLKSKCPTLDEILDVIGFGNAILIYERHNRYRTRAKAEAAGAIIETPNALAIPTMPSYQYSMSLYKNGGAYLQLLRSTDGLKFKGGKMYFESAQLREVSEVELQNMKTKEGIENIDLPILRTFYSLILTEFEKSGEKTLSDVLTYPVQVLAEYIGLQNNLNKKDIARVIEKTQSYHNIVGVVHGTRNGKPVQSLYPVLNFEGYDDKHNAISFSSPYMNYVIRTMSNLAIRKKKDGKKQLKKNGEPLKLPTHSYLIDSSIAKERNKAAVENVVLLVQGIERAGGKGYHIAANTLVERNVQLAERLEAAPQHRAQLLKRVFTKTWELLRTKTRLAEVYKNIELPDPKDPAYIPTVKGLSSMVFEIKHDGKKA
jgi:hypothetical protein